MDFFVSFFDRLRPIALPYAKSSFLQSPPQTNKWSCKPLLKNKAATSHKVCTGWWNPVFDPIDERAKSICGINCCLTLGASVSPCRAVYPGLRQPRCLCQRDVPVRRGLGGTRLRRTDLPLALCGARPVQGRQVWVQPWLGRGPLHHR